MWCGGCVRPLRVAIVALHNITTASSIVMPLSQASAVASATAAGVAVPVEVAKHAAVASATATATSSIETTTPSDGMKHREDIRHHHQQHQAHASLYIATDTDTCVSSDDATSRLHRQDSLPSRGRKHTPDKSGAEAVHMVTLRAGHAVAGPTQTTCRQSADSDSTRPADVLGLDSCWTDVDSDDECSSIKHTPIQGREVDIDDVLGGGSSGGREVDIDDVLGGGSSGGREVDIDDVLGGGSSGGREVDIDDVLGGGSSGDFDDLLPPNHYSSSVSNSEMVHVAVENVKATHCADGSKPLVFAATDSAAYSAVANDLTAHGFEPEPEPEASNMRSRSPSDNMDLQNDLLPNATDSSDSVNDSNCDGPAPNAITLDTVVHSLTDGSLMSKLSPQLVASLGTELLHRSREVLQRTTQRLRDIEATEFQGVPLCVVIYKLERLLLYELLRGNSGIIMGCSPSLKPTPATLLRHIILLIHFS
jgi:hypothetical protein